MRQLKRRKSVASADQFFSSWSTAERLYLRRLLKQFACPKVHIMAKAPIKQCGHWPLWANMAMKLRDDLDKQVEASQLEAFFWIVMSGTASIRAVNRRLDALVVGSGSQRSEAVMYYEDGHDSAGDDTQVWNESTSTALNETVATNIGADQLLGDSSSPEAVSAPVPAFPLSVSRSTSDYAADERGAGSPDSSDVLPVASAGPKDGPLAAELAAVPHRERNLTNSPNEVTAQNTEFTTIVNDGDGSLRLYGDNGEDVAPNCIEMPASVRVARPLVECADKEVQCDMCPTYCLGQLLRFEIALRMDILRREQNCCAHLHL